MSKFNKDMKEAEKFFEEVISLDSLQIDPDEKVKLRSVFESSFKHKYEEVMKYMERMHSILKKEDKLGMAKKSHFKDFMGAVSSGPASLYIETDQCLRMHVSKKYDLVKEAERLGTALGALLASLEEGFTSELFRFGKDYDFDSDYLDNTMKKSVERLKSLETKRDHHWFRHNHLYKRASKICAGHKSEETPAQKEAFNIVLKHLKELN